MDAYYPFKGEPGAPIAVELFKGTQSIPSHTHDFHEFVLLLRGSCKHRYYGQEIPLIPGDVFLVPAHKSHSYIIHQNLTNYNVQFYPHLLGDRWGKLWEPSLYRSEEPDVTGSMQHLVSELGPSGVSTLEAVHHANLNQLGILRLNFAEAEYVSSILGEMYREQQHKSYEYERVLRAYLEIILVIFTRIQKRQFLRPQETPTSKTQAVQNAIEYIEAHFSEPISFFELASSSHLSVNYFRTMFKNVTGLSPVDYMNRIRIIKSLLYLQKGNLPIAEVAALVGINDANYFSRLFKKIIGYPPTYFRKIGE